MDLPRFSFVIRAKISVRHSCVESTSRSAVPAQSISRPVHIYLLWIGGSGSGCRVQGVGLRVQGAGCRVQGAGCRVQGSGHRVQGSGCRVPDCNARAELAGDPGVDL